MRRNELLQLRGGFQFVGGVAENQAVFKANEILGIVVLFDLTDRAALPGVRGTDALLYANVVAALEGYAIEIVEQVPIPLESSRAAR